MVLVLGMKVLRHTAAAITHGRRRDAVMTALGVSPPISKMTTRAYHAMAATNIATPAARANIDLMPSAIIMKYTSIGLIWSLLRGTRRCLGGNRDSTGRSPWTGWAGAACLASCAGPRHRAWLVPCPIAQG